MLRRRRRLELISDTAHTTLGYGGRGGGGARVWMTFGGRLMIDDV